MSGDSIFHCWRHTQGLMNPTEIVVHEPKRQGSRVILDFFRKGIRQPSEASNSHSHTEVLPLRGFQTDPPPAIEAGISDHVWSIEEMCGLLPEMVSSQRRMEKKLVLKPLGRVVISPFGSVFSLVNMAAANDEFPEEFTIQRVRLAAAKGLAGLQPAHIAAYFRDHPEQAKDLLSESYDKRFTPSSFMTERSAATKLVGFRNGPSICASGNFPIWLTRLPTIFCSRWGRVGGTRRKRPCNRTSGSCGNQTDPLPKNDHNLQPMRHRG